MTQPRLNNRLQGDEVQVEWGGETQVRVMSGKHEKQERANETDARQVWTKNQAGGEHYNTGGKQSKRHHKNPETLKWLEHDKTCAHKPYLVTTVIAR